MSSFFMPPLSHFCTCRCMLIFNCSVCRSVWRWLGATTTRRLVGSTPTACRRRRRLGGRQGVTSGLPRECGGRRSGPGRPPPALAWPAAGSAGPPGGGGADVGSWGRLGRPGPAGRDDSGVRAGAGGDLAALTGWCRLGRARRVRIGWLGWGRLGWCLAVFVRCRRRRAQGGGERAAGARRARNRPIGAADRAGAAGAGGGGGAGPGGPARRRQA